MRQADVELKQGPWQAETSLPDPLPSGAGDTSGSGGENNVLRQAGDVVLQCGDGGWERNRVRVTSAGAEWSSVVVSGRQWVEQTHVRWRHGERRWDRGVVLCVFKESEQRMGDEVLGHGIADVQSMDGVQDG
jgi:hypothetical protein